MSNIQENAEQYAREKLGNWCHVAHSGYEIGESTNGEIAVLDFIAGYDFAMSQPKHIFDGVANVGEVRRFEGELVDVVFDRTCCQYCVLRGKMNNCDFITGCIANNVKYIKR
jgi:hypothetical protein